MPHGTQRRFLSLGTLALVAVGVLWLSPAASACPGNLLKDPSFEASDLAEAWGEMASGSLEDMLYHEDDRSWAASDGEYALRFRARMTDDVLAVGQVVELEAGKAYALAFDLLITEPDSNGAVAIALDGDWQDYINIAELPFTGEYQRIEVPLDSSEVSGAVVLNIENPFLDGGDILVDNLCLTAVDDEPVVITAVHVQMTINAALGLGIEPGFQPDANGDGTVDAVDVQLIINAALGVSTNS